jgi:Tsi6
MTATETVERALALTNARVSAAPGFELFASTAAQLKYLLLVLRGEERDRSHLKDIVVGHFAAREFGESDPELAEALMAAQAIGSKAAKGLKV